MIKQLTIIGVGLIGGSLARALKRKNYCQEIVGCGRSEENLQKAVQLGVIDRYETDVAKASKNADILFLSVPLGGMEDIFSKIAAVLSPHTIITDAGSAKTSVIQAAKNVFGGETPFFIPGHPIAGTEKSGVTASFAELYQNRKVILTPLPENTSKNINIIKEMWSQTGADVETMNALHHDEILAATSHLPHILAFSLVDTLACMEENREIFRYAAGGFRDFTRIASSDPVMWHDICIANKDAILSVMSHYRIALEKLTEYIETDDSESLLKLFQTTKNKRDEFID